MTTTPRPDSFTARLDREWAHLRRRPAALRRARSWARLEATDALTPHLGGLRDLDTIVELTRGRSASEPHADEIMCRLVEVARHDTLAGRLLIQRILPGLIARGARYRSFRDGTDPAELVVAAAWIALRRYDWRRRSRHVAASLVSDATFEAFRRPLRLRAATEELRSPHSFTYVPAGDGPTNPVDELAVLLRDAREAGVPTHDLELIRHLVRTGSPGTVARERGVTPRTIRNHRDVAIRRVRAALATAS